ncbi:MAG: TetR/AcrR family transcriptional regulator [Phaeodactylibacter sp.]|nr:TetR/AcrR family transcriptional regulator [Phaeodactylibacter sp.]
MTDIEILKKALSLFNEKGYAHVGMRELARELNISPGNLTYYFKKKEDVLVALLNQFSIRNTQTIESYLQLEPSNANFLRLMRNIFENQFMFRGVYVGNQFFPVVVVEKKVFDYQSVVKKRKAVYQEIFSSLGKAGHLQVNDKDVSFLVSFITLFGRFWITEATLFNKSPNKDEVIEHYLSLFARQLSLFSTDVGKASIKMYGIKF